MTIASVASNAAAAASPSRNLVLGQSDFIRLMTTQMQMQDPTDPVDNKEMIAQMAQFSSLAGIDQMNATLKSIASQLEQVLAMQTVAQPQQPAA